MRKSMLIVASLAVLLATACGNPARDVGGSDHSPEPANRPPTLMQGSTSGPSVSTGENYSITVHAADLDGNLARVELNWNDGTAVESKAVNGSSASVTFTRAYSTPRPINWSATAYDTRDATSDQVTGSFTVVTTNRPPTLIQRGTSGPSVITGENYSITVNAADLDGNLAKVDLNWNDGTAVEHKAVNGSSASVTFTRSFGTPRPIDWSATAYDTRDATSDQVTGSFTVFPTNRPPTLIQGGTSGPSVSTGENYSITVNAADPDGNLAKVDLNWNDGTAVEHKAVSGSSASVTFTRAYATPRPINWSATAYDTRDAISDQVTGSFTVALANRPPTLTQGSTSGPSVSTGENYSITVNAADLDGNLAKVDLNWNDGTAVENKAVDGSSASVTFTRSYSTPRTINWSATAYDTRDATSEQLAGSFMVKVPPNRPPTLTLGSTSGPNVSTGENYSITVHATDPDGNLAKVDLNWNDGTAVEPQSVHGSSASVTFTRSYSTPRTINWSATAFDTRDATSDQVTGSGNVLPAEAHEYQPVSAIGQSNERGAGDERLSPSVAPSVGYAWNPNAAALIPLDDPLPRNNGGAGSMHPAQVNEYFRITRRGMAISPSYEGGAAMQAAADSGAGHWDPASGKLLAEAFTRLNNMLAYMTANNFAYCTTVIWTFSQGESDAQAIDNGTPGVSKDGYKAAFRSMYDAIQAAYPNSLIFITRTGKFGATDTAGFQQVRAAQDELAQDPASPLVRMAYTDTVNFHGRGLMANTLHYNQMGLNEAGQLRGRSIAHHSIDDPCP